MERPFSQACENNKQPILAVLKASFDKYDKVQRVLEIGSGTGQHAVFFAEQLPHVFWQTSDRLENHPAIDAWLAEFPSPNLGAPLILDVNDPWPEQTFDGIFSANTLHIMGWPEVEQFFRGIDQVLASGGILVVYGPFNYAGRYTSDSNARFDQWLKERDPRSGIRDFEAINGLAAAIGLTLLGDHTMPANNRCLVWQRSP